MNSRGIYLIKNMGILTVSNFASKILVFLLVPLYTSVLSTTEYGTYDLVISTVQLIFPLLTMNITDAVMRFSMEKNQDITKVGKIGVQYLTASFLPVGIFVLICHLTEAIPDLQDYLLLIFLYYIFYSSYQFLIQFAKGLEKVVDMGIAGVISTIVLLVTNIMFLLVFKWGLMGFFGASVLAQFIPTVYLSLRLKIWKYFCVSGADKKLKKEMLLYCLPLIFSVVGWWVNNASDKYIVTFICGTAANGVLSVAYKIPSILNVFQNIFVQAWQISAVKEYGGDGTKKFYGDTFIFLNAMMSICCAGLILLSKPIASILYAKDFYVAWEYVPFLLVSSVLNSSAGFLGPILSAAKDSKSMAKSAIYGAGANIIMNVIFVYFVGIQGATIATAISSYIIYGVRKKAVGNQITIDSYWKVLVSWILLCVQAVVEIYFNGYALEIAIFISLLVLNGKFFVKAINMIKIFLKNRIRRL